MANNDYENVTYCQNMQMVFTEKDEALVKESWEIMKNKVPQCSLSLSTVLFELEPSTKELFSFLKGWTDLPHKNHKLLAHMAEVFKWSCEAACKLREVGKIDTSDPTLQRLGSIHVKSGVLDAHFEVVKEALLITIKEAIEGKWSEEMKMSWSKAYDELAAAIKAIMKELRSDQPHSDLTGTNNETKIKISDQGPTSDPKLLC